MGTFSIWHFMLGVVLIVGAIVFCVRVLRVLWRFGKTPKTQAERPALGILEERFARGEIDKEEFEARRRILRE